MTRKPSVTMITVMLVLVPIASNAFSGNSLVYGEEQYDFVRKWGSSGTADGQFEDLQGVAHNSDNKKVYTSNSNGNANPGSNHRIQVFTEIGGFVNKWGTYGSAPGQFFNPFDIAFDSSHNVHVADQGNQRIQKFTSDGSFIMQWGSGFNPTGVAIDSANNVYATEQFDHRVAKFTSEGELIKRWNTHGPYPRGIALDSMNNVYVVTTDFVSDTYTVEKYSSDGAFIKSWSSKGSDSENSFNIYGAAIDKSNNVYVADTRNDRVQKFTSEGALLANIGSGGSANGQFNHPTDVDIDLSTGDLYVADSGNHRIQVFAPKQPDPVPPNTFISKAVDGNNAILSLTNPSAAATVSKKITISFTGSDNVGIAGFHCSLDGKPFSSCSSPSVFNNLAFGTHTFRVIAIDTSGNADPTPAVFTWTVLTPVQGIQKLKSFVSGLQDVSSSTKAALNARLNAALSYLTDSIASNDRGACDQLNAFIRLANAYDSRDVISSQQSKQITTTLPYSAQAIRISLGCHWWKYLMYWNVFKDRTNNSILPWISVDANTGDVFVANTYHNTIQKFTSTGQLLTEFSSEGISNGRSNIPHDVSFDQTSGELYVADTYNHRIQVFAPEIICSTIGTDSNDFLTGSCVQGRGGNDVILGTKGNDLLLDGSNGNDIILGLGWNDFVKGGNGTDWLLGGNGNDELNGEAGNDIIQGESGDDILTGGEGGDRFSCGSGLDMITDFDPAEGDIKSFDFENF